MDYTRIASVIDKAVREQVDRAAPHIRLGTVASASANTASVLIDGSSAPATMVRGCTCSQGDRVIVLREGTQFYVIAKVGG